MSARRILIAAALGLAAGAPSAHAADGDVIVTDPVRTFFGGPEGRVLRVAEAGGAPALVAAGNPLRDPLAVALDAAGRLLVVDESAEALFAVAPSDGAVTVVAAGPPFVEPVGVAVVDGVAYVTDRGTNVVLRVDLATGAVSTVARGFSEPDGIAVEPRGSLLVADQDAAGDGAVLRVDPGTGSVTTLASGPLVDQPRDVAVGDDGSVFVTGDSDGAYVLRVDPDTGASKLLAAGAPLSSPRGIGLQAGGNLLVADRSGPDDRGGVIGVNRDTGALTVLSSGSGYVNPTGLAIVGGAGFADSGLSVSPGGGPGGGGPAGGGPGAGAGAGGAGGAPGTGPAVDHKAPVLTAPKLRPTTFRAARRGGSIAVAIGTTITYKLDEAARVRFTVQKSRPLSRVCKRRLAKQSRHRTGLRCARWISIKGHFSKASVAGISSLRFTGRLNRRGLRPGTYRLVVRATDHSGNVTKPRRSTFHIVP